MFFILIVAIVLFVVCFVCDHFSYSSKIMDTLNSVFEILFMLSVICMVFSCPFVEVTSKTNSYCVAYEEGELKVVDESPYSLTVTERMSYDWFKKGVKSYSLFKNTDKVKSSKNLEDIKKYFERKPIRIE